MAISNEFSSYIMELLRPFENVTKKRMFGGYGIFKEGIMFALISDDTLYFKTDEFNRFEFERLNLTSFTYMKKNKEIATSYYKAPDEVFDNSDEMVRWAQLGFEASLRKSRK